VKKYGIVPRKSVIEQRVETLKKRNEKLQKTLKTRGIVPRKML
jgi:hypothetical protein